MKRVTYRTGRGKAAFLLDGKEITGEVAERLAAYEETGLAPEEIQDAVDMFEQVAVHSSFSIPKEVKDWIGRCTWHVRKCDELHVELERFQRAEAERRLVVLPCKLRSQVYLIVDNEILAGVVRQFRYDRGGLHIIATYHLFDADMVYVFGDLFDFGKNVFIDRKEAEEALRKEKGNDE